ncbi:MAG: AbrB/MazE/SpoVT family DNA-binding domain-containing protein [bacterium]
MKTAIVPIGNSKGIRIPKVYLNELNIKETVDLEVKNQTIIIRPIKNKPRENWEECFKKMHTNNDDRMHIHDSLDIDQMDFEWK